jgi:UPF0755 protein
MDSDLKPASKFRAKYIILVFIALLIIAGAYFGYIIFAQKGSSEAEVERYIVPLKSDKNVFADVKEKGFVSSSLALAISNTLHGVVKVDPGAYRISKSMTPWQISRTFKTGPYMKWVVIPEGLRKEEIADLMQENLGWSEQQKYDWVTKYTNADPNYVEGVYFPDTYLISLEESPQDVASRLRRRFEEKFAPYSKEAVAQNIRWPTLIKLASIVQREANGKQDMPLVAGILWNRLEKNMRLEVDATLQYARGDKGAGFWAPITPAEKQINSPFNTYRNTGLPPRPISNPGISAIEASLRPASTTCLYYLHDKKGEIHCATTYEEHKLNIEKYLK